MSEDYFISKVNNLSSLLINNGFELFLLSFCAGSWLCFFELVFLRIHFIIDLKWSLRKDFKESFSIIVYIDDVATHRRKQVLFVVNLKIEVRIGVSE